MTEASTAELPPRANPHLVGQSAAEAELLASFRSQRMAHAWLLRGPRGIGKATLAYRFARWVLAGADRPSAPPSGTIAGGLFGDSPPATPAADSLYLNPTNPVFRRIAAAGHADLMTVEIGSDDKGKRYSEVRVEDVREVGRFLSLTAAEGGWRIVIIDSADEMNRNAANALLKVLEEPPRRALLLLVSHSPGALLPTVRSRCRGLTLHPLKENEVDGLLSQRLSESSASDRRVLTDLADGSIGRALDLAGEGGLEVHGELMGLVGSLPELDIGRLHRFAEKMARQSGETAFRAASYLLLWWLSRLIAAAAGRPPVACDPEQVALFARIARPGNLDRWMEVWEKINRLLVRTDAVNLDRRQVMLTAMLAIRDAARP